MRRRFSFLLFLLGLVILPVPQTVIAMPKPVIVDTDLDVDDVIAILYLVKNPAVEVKAISIESLGPQYCTRAVRNTAGVLKLAHQSAIPVGCGPESGLHLQHRYYTHSIQRILTLSGTANLLPPANKKFSPAVELMLKTLKESSEPVTILAIGQLTNIATVLEQAPAIKNKIREIVIMGGAIRVPGNVSANGSGIANNVSEWNLYIDAPAAKKVFSAGVPIRLISLDATNTLPIDENFYQALQTSHISDPANYLYAVLHQNHKIISCHQWYFWDPAAAVLLTDPALASWRQEHLRVSLVPKEAGRLIVDNVAGHPVSVCQLINKHRFESLLLKTIN